MAAALAACDRLGSKPEQEADATPVPPAVVETAEVQKFEGGLKLEGVATLLNSDALIQLDADIRTAEAAVEFSKGQLERFEKTKSLAIQTVATAERQAKTDETQLQLLKNKLVQTWGKSAPFLEEAARNELVGALSSGAKALVRLDFPEPGNAQPKSIRVASLQGSPEQAVAKVWEAPSGNQTMPGVAYFGLIDTAAGLRPGDRARVLAERPETLSGVIVPSAALVIYDAQSWCYVVTGANTYERRPVTLDHPVQDGYVMQSGFPPGTRIVVRGASMLLAREAGPGEDDDDDGAAASKAKKAPAAAPSDAKPKDDDIKDEPKTSSPAPAAKDDTVPTRESAKDKDDEAGKNKGASDTNGGTQKSVDETGAIPSTKAAPEAPDKGKKAKKKPDDDKDPD